jgi:hypothetical protein
MMTRSLLLATTALLLAACGGGAGDTPTGITPSTIRMKISPDSTTLSRNQAKFFKASPMTGNIPAGARYVWAVLGAGTLSAAAGDSVKFTAPAADGVDTLTVQVLDAASQPIGGGATPIRTAGGVALSLALSPIAPHVESQTGAGTQLFIITATTGSLPVGGSFAWTIKGAAPTTGKFSTNGSTSATTTVNNVTYISPDSATSDTLTVDVKNSSGIVVGRASTPISVFAGLRWTNSGANTLWAANNYGNGSYLSPGGGFGRVDVNIGGGVEQVSCVYQNKFPVRLAGFQQFNVTFYAPQNVRVQPGNAFVQSAGSGTAAGTLSIPQVTGVNTITLTVTTVERQSDGSDFLTYTFATAGNQAGYTGAMSGTGQCVVRYPF